MCDSEHRRSVLIHLWNQWIFNIAYSTSIEYGFVLSFYLKVWALIDGKRIWIIKYYLHIYIIYFVWITFSKLKWVICFEVLGICFVKWMNESNISISLSFLRRHFPFLCFFRESGRWINKLYTIYMVMYVIWKIYTYGKHKRTQMTWQRLKICLYINMHIE